jgi:ribose transport system permease protein
MTRVVARNRPVVIAYGLALGLFVLVSIFSTGFASSNHVGLLLTETSFIGLVALGQTYVIIGGGIDLSLPAVMTTSAVLLTTFTGHDQTKLAWVIPVLLLGSAVVGIINGAGVALLRISPIVMTLAVQSVVTGLLLVGTHGASGDNVAPAVTALATTKVLAIPVEVFIWLGIGLVGAFVLARSAYGRRLYAVGTSPVVAELSGVNVRRVTVTAYVVSALCAGVAGILFAGYAGQSYLSLGNPYLFPSIAAVAIGGAAITGGNGNYIGTIAGALLLAVLAETLPVLQLKTAWVEIIYGVVILSAVGLGGLRFRRSPSLARLRSAQTRPSPSIRNGSEPKET